MLNFSHLKTRNPSSSPQGTFCFNWISIPFCIISLILWVVWQPNEMPPYSSPVMSFPVESNPLGMNSSWYSRCCIHHWKMQKLLINFDRGRMEKRIIDSLRVKYIGRTSLPGEMRILSTKPICLLHRYESNIHQQETCRQREPLLSLQLDAEI